VRRLAAALRHCWRRWRCDHDHHRALRWNARTRPLGPDPSGRAATAAVLCWRTCDDCGVQVGAHAKVLTRVPLAAPNIPGLCPRCGLAHDGETVCRAATTTWI